MHRMRQISVHSTLRLLAQLICSRLLVDLPTDDVPDDEAYVRLEKAVVTYTLFATAQNDSQPAVTADDIASLLDAIHQRSKRPLSAEATHASQTLIWKATGAVSGEASESWCQLLQHDIFDGAGLVNKARIGR